MSLNLMHRRVDVHVESAGYGRFVNVYISVESRNDAERVVPALPLQFGEPVEPLSAGAFEEPTMRLNLRDASKLMDALWNAGIRPSRGVDEPGALAATKEHLADMRTIATAALRKVGVTS
jgi:hypothetical protein